VAIIYITQCAENIIIHNIVQMCTLFDLYIINVQKILQTLTVEYVFYIRGHTKNACDRMFNQMKLKLHRRDIFSWGQVRETLNIKKHINIVDAQESHFKDHGALLDKFYVNFKPNTIQKNIFSRYRAPMRLSPCSVPPIMGQYLSINPC
jgi:hypothetical protein